MARFELNQFKDIVDQIETSMDMNPNVLQLAEQTGLSPWHFQKLFKGLVGDSLGAYVRGRKLTKAADLLKHSQLGILDIALEVGFNSHEAFSRSFKQQFEISPSDFRESEIKLNLKQKPKLTDELLNFFVSRINKKPEIMQLAQRKIIGYTQEIDSPFVDKIHCSTIASPWMSLLQRIPELGLNMSQVQLHGITMSDSGNYTEDTLTYMAGVLVENEFQTPADLHELILPEQKIALFQVATHVVDDNLKQKIDAIYGYIIANKEYERAPGYDYELFQNMVDPMKGMFDSYYAVPIR